jgi:hypothetical protein
MNIKKALPFIIVGLVMAIIMVFQLVSFFTSFSWITVLFFLAFGAALYFYFIPQIKEKLNEPQV